LARKRFDSREAHQIFRIEIVRMIYKWAYDIHTTMQKPWISKPLGGCAI